MINYGCMFQSLEQTKKYKWKDRVKQLKEDIQRNNGQAISK